MPQPSPEITSEDISKPTEVDAKPVPEELLRMPTGSSVFDPESVFDSENGREYHGYKEGKYLLPNDAAEQDRLDLQHTALVMAQGGKLALAPMTETPNLVLDVATGTGIWALEWAEQNPESYVVGTDLSKIQPDRGFKNCEFIKEDSEEEWLFPYKFDLVHLRMVVSCFDNPKKVLNHAVQNLNPGGWIEYQDIQLGSFSDDGSLEGTAIEKVSGIFRAGMKARGRDPDVPLQYKNWLHEAGCVNVVEQIIHIPLNNWPEDREQKKIGQFWLANSLEGIRGILWQVLRGLNMPPAEIEEVVTEYKRNARDTSVHGYVKLYVVYGQKPFDVDVQMETI